jgi:hypothetical protein
VIVATAVLVVRDHEQGLRPVCPGAHRGPYFGKKALAVGDVVRGVLVVGLDGKAGLDEGVAGERAVFGINLELGELVEGSGRTGGSEMEKARGADTGAWSARE